MSQRNRRGVAMFVVLGVVVFVTMLGFMGLMMARNDALGSGDVLSARSTEAAAFSGINLALASLASNPAQTATILQKFVVDSASTTPRAWFNFDPASGPFDLEAAAPDSARTIVSGAGSYSVQVRILSLDIGGTAGVPAGGIKITLSSTGTGRSGDEYTTVASYRILGIDVARMVDVANTGMPTHALYLGGSLNNASGNLETQGSVYVSGDYAGNSGANTIHGRLKVGGNMNLPSGNPQTIDSNTWIGGSLTVNSGNRLHYKMNLGVGRGLCLMNDSITVDSSFNLYGTCPSSLTWQNERQIRVNGRQFLLRNQVFASTGSCWVPVYGMVPCPSPLRRGRLVVPNGRAFLNTGLHTADGADPSTHPSDSIRFLRLGAASGPTGCGGMTSYAGRQVRVDSIYSHTVCSLTVKTTGSPAPALIVNQAARLGYVKAGRIAVAGGGTGWSYASSNLPAGHNATGTWIYGGANDDVVPEAPSKGLLELGVPAIDTMAAIADNPPNTIDLSPTMVAKLQRVSSLRVKSGVTTANLSESGTGRYINRMIDTASKYGLLHNGYLLLWIDESINIKYNANTDLIKGRVLYVIDRAVYSGFNWPPSKDSGAIQILYFPRAQAKHDTTFAGTGSFGNAEFGLVDGDFYGYVYSEILMNIRTKFDTEFRGAIAFTVTGSSMEMQASGKNADATLDNTLNVILDKNVFSDIQSKLGVIKDPAGSSGTPTLVVSRANGFVVRQSRLQFVPLGEYR